MADHVPGKCLSPSPAFSVLCSPVTGEAIISEDQFLETECPIKKTSSSELEVVLKVHKGLYRNFSTSSSVFNWSPELRLLRILQEKDDGVDEALETELESESALVDRAGSVSPSVSKGSRDS